MFSFSGPDQDQVLRLREGFGVYAVASGRVNVAGMTPDNMAPRCAETIVFTVKLPTGVTDKKACTLRAFHSYQTGISSCRKGLCRRSYPSVESGPWRGIKVTSSPSSNLRLIASINFRCIVDRREENRCARRHL